MKLFLSAIFLLLCLPWITKAQEDPFSQEYAEKMALQQYELIHPPLLSMPMPDSAANEAFLGAHLTRSATLLASSNPERHIPVKIMIYGQSITGSTVFTEQITKYIKEKFPYAAVTIENKAIGGFTAEHILRTAAADLYPAYPDLIIFHVYGGDKTGELEQLFTNIRRYTTSDILLMSHHLNASQTKTDEIQAKYLRYIAAKYNCELADIATEWPQYLEKNHMKPTDLLRDGVHPNRNGNWLLAQLVGRHIRYNPLFPSDWYRNVRNYYALTAFDAVINNPLTLTGNWNTNNGTLVSDSKKSSIKLSFSGNRVDLISGHPLKLTGATGTARLLLDGKAIEGSNLAYTITRPSTGKGTWWPAIQQVSHTKPLIAEEWTLHVDGISEDSTVFRYHVTGTKTGDDGSGVSNELFISRSGRVQIRPDDILFNWIKTTFKVSTPTGFEVKWSVVPLFSGTLHPVTGNDRTAVYRTILLQGIENGPHTLEIIPSGDGPIAIESFEVHEPDLK